MSIRDDFLEEIQEGDYVEVTYGQQGTRTIAGTVLRITSSMVRLECADRSPRIALDSIISYDTPEAPHPAPEQMRKPAAQPARTPIKPNPAVARPAAQATPPAPPAVPKPRDPEVLHYMNLCLGSSRPSDIEIADWDYLMEDIQKSCSPEVRSRVSGFADSFQSIRKQFTQAGSTRDTENKLHDLRARMLRLIQENPADSEFLFDMLGSIHFQLHDYAHAAEYFSKGHDYEGAYYAAASSDDRAKCPDYLEKYVREDGNTTANLLLQYARQAAQQKDVSALRERKDTLCSRREALDEDDQEDIRILISCAVIIADTAGLPQNWLIDNAGQTELKRFEAFFQALPKEWGRKPEPPQAFRKGPEHQDEDSGEYISAISAFYAEKCIGFLPEQEHRHDCFFHIKQVDPEGPLRSLLANGMALGLQVSYRHGVNFDGKMAATGLTLTKEGLLEAQRRIETGIRPYEPLTGDLDTYDRQGDLYWINRNNKGYSLRRDGIADPYLKAYLSVRFSFHVRVEFELHRLGTRDVAVNVRFAGDGETVSETELQQAIREGVVTQEELDGWPERRRLLDDELEKPRMIAAAAEERFASMPYFHLPLWRFSMAEEPSRGAGDTRMTRQPQEIRAGWDSREPRTLRGPQEPRTFRGPQEPRTFRGPQEPRTFREPQEPRTFREPQEPVYAPRPISNRSIHLDPSLRLPALEPLPAHTNRFESLPPYQSILQEGQLYEHAASLLQSNRLDLAEEYFIRSIQAGERIDASVLGLLNLYLRDESRVLDAVDLLDTYGSYLDAYKRRNQEISVYQKGRERPFKIKLCHLLEAGLDFAPRTSVQLHYLALQGHTLRQLEEYTLALDSYRRWKILYDEELQSLPAANAQQLANGRSAILRGEAACYYLLGDTAQAFQIADELLRANPSDPFALDIRSGTFGKTDAASPGKAAAGGKAPLSFPENGASGVAENDAASETFPGNGSYNVTTNDAAAEPFPESRAADVTTDDAAAQPFPESRAADITANDAVTVFFPEN